MVDSNPLTQEEIIKAYKEAFGSSNAVEVNGGIGAKEQGGNGANGLSATSANGNAGTNYGGGGSGGYKTTGANRSGGAGAQGLIRIIYR
jgi:hypothetical protein